MGEGGERSDIGEGGDPSGMGEGGDWSDIGEGFPEQTISLPCVVSDVSIPLCWRLLSTLPSFPASVQEIFGAST